MPRPRPLDNWEPEFVTLWLEALDHPVNVAMPSPRDARNLRETLYVVRKAMRREADYDKRVDRVAIHVDGRNLRAELKRSTHLHSIA